MQFLGVIWDIQHTQELSVHYLYHMVSKIHLLRFLDKAIVLFKGLFIRYVELTMSLYARVWLNFILNKYKFVLCTL